MGTTARSGWAMFWFLLGFTILGTTGIGGGVLSVLGGVGLIVLSALLFKSARAQEES